MKKTFFALGIFLVLLLVPFVLREAPDAADAAESEDTLVVVTPHVDSIKSEFEHAFREYYFKKYNRSIKIDYRNMGGTSDIIRYISDRFESEFRRYYESKGLEWNNIVRSAFTRNQPANAPAEAKNARKMFLESNVGIGIDLFFGGGTFDQARMAQNGYASDAEVAKRHPEYFSDKVIPPAFAGEIFYDKNGLYYGVCLSSFGICINPDAVAECGVAPADIISWDDMGRKEFFGKVVVADPSKSGSVTKCFESILQAKMYQAVNKYGAEKGLEIGFAEGFDLVRRIVANSRAVTDSAGKVTREVAAGNGAIGMAIDFYTLAEQQFTAAMSPENKAKIRYITPKGGSFVSADPVQLLRGAPNRKQACDFIDFCLSEEGQKLWNHRPGVAGGPRKYALLRPPIRRDIYEKADRKLLSEGSYNPYVSSQNVYYNGRWTGPYFNLIRILIRTTMLDVIEEMREAHKAILEAGGYEKVPQASAAFHRMIVPYSDAKKASNQLRVSANHSAVDVAAVRRNWSAEAIKNYRTAAELARRGL
ncbi:MAG: extracellular solute-binding protein [Lentisphaeria bacterium]|nr:extracellular solute-binding protein [Lentisphaeria bacterium]